MKLKHMKLENFQCFKCLDLEFDDITLILADNGGGKSSVLEAIRLSFGALLKRFPDISGVDPTRKHLRIDRNGHAAPYLRITSVLDSGIQWDRTHKRDKSKKTQAAIPPAVGFKYLNSYADSFIDAFNDNEKFILPIIAYYSTERSVVDEMPQRRRNWQKSFRPFDALQDGLLGKANFRRFLEWFNEMEEQERRERERLQTFQFSLPALSVVRNAIEKMIPNYSNPRIEKSPLRFVVDRNGVEFRIDQLSDGFRITLAMVADIAGRLAEANPNMTEPLEAPGIVLIDEVDLHLHPKWQRRIVSDLRNTFPNVQFIITTHSPVVALGSPDEKCTIIHFDTNHNKQVQPKSSLETFNINRLLVSEFFDLPNSRNPKWDEKIARRDELLKREETEPVANELKRLNAELLPLSGESKDDVEARRIIQEAARILSDDQD